MHLVAAGHADQVLRAGADRVDVGEERLLGLGLGLGSRQDRSRGIGDRARPDKPEKAIAGKEKPDELASRRAVNRAAGSS
ncbi:MAG TPA: hypothetical protein VJY33_26835 [Isosphaeraceae bacterium]|nr:hypothetical protein [Isosphaeraceae bacterium]